VGFDTIGQHSIEILRDVLNYSEERIQALLDEKVTGGFLLIRFPKKDIGVSSQIFNIASLIRSVVGDVLTF
jgi:hypothetical protein